MGISSKCFEILENRPSNYDLRSENSSDSHGGTYTHHDPLLSDEESETTEDDEDEDLDGVPTGGGVNGVGESDSASEDEDDRSVSDGEESWVGDEKRGPRLRIREILMYEEKVSVLSARHGYLKPTTI